MDAEFFAMEESTTPMHLGSLSVFRKPEGGVNYDLLLAAVESVLPQVPRYWQKVREVAFNLARPVWVDDPDFDITYHVRRSALPQPGSNFQLHDLVARLNSRPLDRGRPLWEMYLVEGLADGRMAIFTKSHEALVDGRDALEIMHVLLEPQARLPIPPTDMWMSSDEPGDAQLIVGAVLDLLSQPKRAVDLLKQAADEIVESASGLPEAVGDIADRAVGLARSRSGVAPHGPLNVPISRSRRYGVATMELAQFSKLRAAFDCTVNDLLITVVTGALRTWLISRGEAVHQQSTVRALVPISVYGTESSGDEALDDDQVLLASPGEVQSYLVDLPVGEANSVVQLRQVAHITTSAQGRSRQVAARKLAKVKGFAPTTFHSMGARAAMAISTRQFNILITNAPGPQVPMYLAGNELLEIFPVPPLVKNQVVTIGITSYNGRVFFGLNADRDGMWDVVSMTEFLYEALEELAAAAR